VERTVASYALRMPNECSNDSDRLVQTDRGWVEVGVPAHCPNGHELQGNIDPKLRAVRVLGRGHRALDVVVPDLQGDDLRPAMPGRIEVSRALEALGTRQPPATVW
jgi:hypothetical protein